jgi:solute carrier family 27 fatty acid transporter 1/4
MIGNGLRPQLWAQFLSRFNSPLMAEVYGATEGNCSLANIGGHVGAIGFLPILLRSILPQTLIRIDPETGDPLRDPVTGLLIPSKVNEPGEMIGKILRNDPVREFGG